MPRVPRKTMRKAKRAMANKKKRAVRTGGDTFFLRAKTTGSIVPTQGATVANYTSNFWQLIDTNSVVGVTQNSEFGLYAQLYDRVRINRMRIRIIPKANVLDQLNAQSEGLANVSGDGMVHTIVSRDNDSYSTSIARLQRVTSYKRYSVLKPITRTYGITYPKGVWLDCQDVNANPALLTQLGASGGVGLYAENILEENSEFFNEPWAALEITYDCVFQGKAGSALSMTDDGKICVAKPVFENYPQSTVVAISGTFNDTRVTGFDLSGALVEVSKNDDSTP